MPVLLDQERKLRQKEAKARYRAKHAEQILAYDAAYRQANREAVRARSRDWKRRNAERVAEYRQANKEAAAAASRAHYLMNRAGVAERHAAWQRDNPEKAREYSRAWAERHRDRYLLLARLKEQRRRANLAAGGAAVTEILVSLRLEQQRWTCPACKASLRDRGWHIDHIKALANGGTNDPDNIQLLCPSCNSSKGAKDPVEFMQQRGFLL